MQEVVDDINTGIDRAQALAERVARRSPTALAAFKRGMLQAIGRTPDERSEIEARAYETCLDSGDAAIGRENFKAITSGASVSWNQRSR